MGSSPPASDDDRYQDDLWKQPTHARLLVSDADAGRVIGRRGSAVTAVESTSGAHVKLSRRGQFLPGTDSRVLLVSGLFHQVMEAAELILEKIIYQGDQVIDDRANVVLVVPDTCRGALIGKGGTVIKSLAIASNAGIVISPQDICYGLNDRLVTITGHLDNQLQAIFLILSELLEDDRYSCSYAGVPFPYPVSSVWFEDHGPDEHVERYHSRTPMRSPDNNDDDAQESITLAIADEHIGAVIGRNGKKIKEIIQATGAWIKTSAKGDFIAGTNDREVVISGTREAVDAAEVMIMHVVSVARRRSDGERPPVEPDTTPQQLEDLPVFKEMGGLLFSPDLKAVGREVMPDSKPTGSDPHGRKGLPRPSSPDCKATGGDPHGGEGSTAYVQRPWDVTKGLAALDFRVGSRRTAAHGLVPVEVSQSPGRVESFSEAGLRDAVPEHAARWWARARFESSFEAGLPDTVPEHVPSWLYEDQTPVQTDTIPIQRSAVSEELLDMEEVEEEEYFKSLVDRFIAAAYPPGMNGAVATGPGQQEATTTPRASARGMEARQVAELEGSTAVVSTSPGVHTASLVADMRMVPRERWTWKYQTTEDGPNGLTVLSPIKKQPTKDSCLPTALGAVMESNLRVQHKKDSILSVDHLIRLSLNGRTKFPNDNVAVRRLFLMVEKEGVLSEQDYKNPQTASAIDACRYHITEHFYYASADPGNMRRALYMLRKGGPLMGVIKISENYDECAKSGQIYRYDPNLVEKDEEGKPKSITHAVCIISFAIEKSAFLECQDSHGDKFAKDGFLNIDVTSLIQLLSIVVR